MSIGLPSGSTVKLSLSQDSTVGDLKVLAQESFGQFLRLVTATGHVLIDPLASLQAAGMEEGTHLTAVAQQAQISATERAFAAWYVGGERIVTWGDRSFGGDSSSIEVQLKHKNIQQVQATRGAFAAVLADGSVVTVHGVTLPMVVRASRFKVSFETCVSSMRQGTSFWPFWQMDQR